MQTLIAIVTIVAPVFAIIALGFALARLRIVNDRLGRLIGRFVFDVAIPGMLLRTMVTMAAPDASPWALWAAYFGGAAVSGGLAAAAVLALVQRTTSQASVAALGGAYSNTVLLGLPLVLSFFGDQASVPMFIIISVHLPLMTFIGTALVEWTSTEERTRIGALLWQTGKAMATNPIIIGLAAGLAWRTTGLGLALPVDAVLGWLAWIAVPTALFAMGLALNRFGFTGDVGATGAMLACKLVLHPAIVWLFATRLLDLPDVWIAVAVLFAACPPGINVFLFASRYDIAVPAVSSAIAVGTALSAVTITLVAWSLGLHMR
jgi:hypothetical protein